MTVSRPNRQLTATSGDDFAVGSDPVAQVDCFDRRIELGIDPPGVAHHLYPAALIANGEEDQFAERTLEHDPAGNGRPLTGLGSGR